MNQSGKRTESKKSTINHKTGACHHYSHCSVLLCFTLHRQSVKVLESRITAIIATLLRPSFCLRTRQSTIGSVAITIINQSSFYYHANTTTPSTTFGFWIHSSPTLPHQIHRPHENLTFWSLSDILLTPKINQSPEPKCSPNTQSPPLWPPLWPLVRSNNLVYLHKRPKSCGLTISLYSPVFLLLVNLHNHRRHRCCHRKLHNRDW